MFVDFSLAKELKSKVKELNIQIDKISNTKDVNLYTEGKGFVKSVDKRKMQIKQLELKGNQLILSALKYKYFLAKKKTVLQLLEEYISCLTEEINYLRTQKTVRKTTGYILDYAKIHRMESLILVERSKYNAILKSRFHTLREFLNMLKNNKKIIIILAILFIAAPILSGLLVSFPSVKWLETHNDWIGFWGSYIGGNIGAIIGGFVAYKVAQYGFNEQKILDRENHITALKVEKISDFVSCVLVLQQRVALHKSYINLAYNSIKSLYMQQEKSDEIRFDSNIFDISRTQDTIRNNRKDIYYQLESYQNHHEIISYLIRQYGEAINKTHSYILETLNLSDQFEDLLELCKEETFSKNKTISFKSFDKGLADFNNLYNSVDYELYVLKVKLKNEIANELHLSETILEDKAAYLAQRQI